MTAFRVVKHLDIVEDVALGLFPGAKEVGVI